MPGTPTTITWWNNHLVGSQGSVIISGCPTTGGVDWGYLNSTFLLDLDTSFIYDPKQIRFFKVVSSKTLVLGFNGLGALEYFFYSGSGLTAPNSRSVANESAVLADLTYGFTMFWDGTSFSGGGQDWSNFSLQWLGTEVDGVGPSSGTIGRSLIHTQATARASCW
ncbi:MAG: hypothetical protein V4719_10750 [Planctomycetota bacterium]